MTQNFEPEKKRDSQLQQGSVLNDRYSVQEVIGVGGMGAVYLARDLHFPNAMKLVAVKEMVNQARDPAVRFTMVQNFEREANILVTLNHRAIPRVFDYFSEDDRSYVVLEYVHGKNLEALLAETKEFFNEEQVVGWAIELCDVLQYLHTYKEHPIIFRDMKPSNVMVNQDGHIVLVDFGIAKVFQSGQKGTMIGTEGYSPPEQYRGEGTPQADIYALGATLHHLLTRRDPRLEAPFTFNERPIRKINPQVSVELEAVIQTSLQYNAHERFASAEMMKQALIGVAHKTGLLPKIAPMAAVSPISSKPDSIQPVWTFKCEDEVRGGVEIAEGVLYCSSYDNNLYALNPQNGEFLWKYPTEGGLAARPTFSEGLVVVGSEDNRVYALSARMGKLVWTVSTDGPVRCSAAIAEGHVFIGSDDGYMHAINLQTSRRAWKYDAGGAIRSTPVVNQDLVYFGSNGADLHCVDFRGQVRWRFHAKRGIQAGPACAANAVFFPSLDSTLYAVDGKSGWGIWRYRMGKGSVSTPCVHGDSVFVGAADGKLYNLGADSGKELWIQQLGAQVSGSPLVFKDKVYIGVSDGSIYCLDARNGKVRWKYTTGGPITSAPVVYNDVLYIGSADHQVYAFIP